MTMQVAEPFGLYGVSLTAHPVGCRRIVEEAVRALRPCDQADGTDVVIVIGGSSGYGFASALVAALGYRLPVLIVCQERGPQKRRPASAGWYRSCAFADISAQLGLDVAFLNADAFAAATKGQVVEILSGRHVRLLIHSLAAPKRVDSDGREWLASIKPVGAPFTTKTLRADSGTIDSATISPASAAEVDATVKVMGGDDWEHWVEALTEANMLGRRFETLAFSYDGPPETWPLYRSGTLGRAKRALEESALRLRRSAGVANAWVSVNGAALTGSSAAIPGATLYLALLRAAASLLGRSLPSEVDQMSELLAAVLGNGDLVEDERGRVHADQWELDSDLQDRASAIHDIISTENAATLLDLDSFRAELLRLSGFEVPGVPYEEPVEIHVPFPDVAPWRLSGA